jgi:1-acylglycerone phosphate reductase
MAVSPHAAVVFVSGCSSGGIGYSCCEEFAARGCKVYATARRPERMAGLEYQGCTLLELDTTDQASINAAVAKV